MYVKKTKTVASLAEVRKKQTVASLAEYVNTVASLNEVRASERREQQTASELHIISNAPRKLLRGSAKR